jgi:S-DNA-T family DNA segregation ATPase FtsK/SpoIIIE
MAYQTRDRAPLLDSDTQAALEKRGKELLGLSLIGAGLLAALMLATYSPSDPNWMLASDAETQNWLGRFGASIAHPLMMIVGRASWGLPLVLLAWGLRLFTHRAEERARSVFAPIFVAALAAAFATLPPTAGWTQAYGMGGLFGDTALGIVLTVIPLGTLIDSLLVWAGALALGLFVLGVTKAEIRAARAQTALALVLGYAWALRTGARALLLALDAFESGRDRARAAMAERAERAAAERARLEEEEMALRAIPEPEDLRPIRTMPGAPPARAAIHRPQATAPAASFMPPPLAGTRPAPAPASHEDDAYNAFDDEEDLGEFDDLADPDDIEAELWAEPAPLTVPPAPFEAPAPAFLAAPAPDHAPILTTPRGMATGFLANLLRRARGETEPAPDAPAVLGEDDRIRARIGDAIRAREAPSARAEPTVVPRALPQRRPLIVPEAVPAATLRAEAPMRDLPAAAPRRPLPAPELVEDLDDLPPPVVPAPVAPARAPRRRGPPPGRACPGPPDAPPAHAPGLQPAPARPPGRPVRGPASPPLRRRALRQRPRARAGAR